MPIVDGLEEEFEGRVSVFRLNVSDGDNAALQNQLGLSGHPAFAILNENEQIVQIYFGPQTAEILREAMTAASP